MFWLPGLCCKTPIYPGSLPLPLWRSPSELPEKLSPRLEFLRKSTEYNSQLSGFALFLADRFSLQPWVSMALPALILDFWPPQLGDNIFLLLQVTLTVEIVRTVLGNKQTQCWITHDSYFMIGLLAVQLLSHVRLSVTPWIAACQASLSFTISWSLLRLMFLESEMGYL